MANFVESFDQHNGVSTTGMALRWTRASSVGQSVLDVGRFGVGQSIALNSGAAGGEYDSWSAPLGFQNAAFSFHAAINQTVFNASAPAVFSLGDGTTAQIGLKVNADASVSIMVGGTVTTAGTALWTSGAGVVSPGWHSFAMKGVINDTTGSVSLRMDGTELVSLTNVDTKSSANAYVNSCLLRSNRDTQAGIDDIVILDSAAAYLADLRIDPYSPNSDDAPLNLVPSTGVSHYAVVDDRPVSNADYLQGSVVGDADALGLPNMAAVPVTIYGVNLVGYAAKTDVAVRAWNLGVDSGGTIDNGADLVLAQTMGYFSRLLLTDPNTAAGWAAAGIDALKLRPRVAV